MSFPFQTANVILSDPADTAVFGIPLSHHPDFKLGVVSSFRDAVVIPISLAYPPGSELRELVDYHVLKMFFSGLIKWIKDSSFQGRRPKDGSDRSAGQFCSLMIDG